MSKPTSYAGFVHRGRKIRVDNKTYQTRVGAVSVTLIESTLFVGWSLCNNKEGDRFNPEMAMSLAEGRARLQHTNSLKFSTKAPPSTQEMINMGVPQSCLTVMSQLISKALEDHGTSIKKISVFNTKTEKVQPQPQYMW